MIQINFETDRKGCRNPQMDLKEVEKGVAGLFQI